MKIVKLITAILILAMITACAATEAPETVPDYSIVEDGVIDLNGSVYRMSAWSVANYFPVMGETAPGDKMLERYAALEKEYNCVFTYINTDGGQYDPSVVTTPYIAGMPVPDIIDRQVDTAYALYRANFLASMDDISTINSSDSKWGPMFYRAHSMFDGTPYGFVAYEWEKIPEINGLLLINNQLIKQMALEDPYEMVENDNWTWDKMTEQLALGTRTEGEKTYTGMVVNSAGDIPFDLLQTTAFSNGAQMIIEKNGKNVFGFNTPEALAAFDYILSMYSNGYMRTADKSAFINGETPYYYTRSFEAISTGADAIGNTMQEYGLVPFPQGPSSPGNVTGTYVAFDRLLYIVKMTENDLDSIGLVIDYLFAPLDDAGGWQEFAHLIFHHDEDLEFYIDGINRPNYNYQVLLGDQYGALKTAALGLFSGTSSPSEAMNSVEAAINAQIEAANIQIINQ